MRVHDSGGPLADEEFFISPDDKCDKPPRGCCFALGEIRQFLNAVFPECDAKFSHRTNTALRIARRANQRAKFHERLVQGGAISHNRSSRH